MPNNQLLFLEKRFVTEGGIKERMQNLQRELEHLRHVLQQKDVEIRRLREIIGLA